MSEKRRDKKGRILRSGEYQRKDGKYEYKYVDNDGNRRSVYSWQLVSTDRVPEGRKSNKALRDIETEILHVLSEGLCNNKRVIFDDCFTQYMKSKRRLKNTTRSYYIELYERYIKSTLGDDLIDEISVLKIKRYYENILYERNLSLQTLKRIHNIVHPVLQVAVDNKHTKDNPASKAFEDIKNEYGKETSKPRIGLTEDQQNNFVRFLSTYHNQRFYDMVVVLLGTGCRLGEILGLTWDDCDFDNAIISVNHSLAYFKDDSGKRSFHITTTKTSASTREIPMLDVVREALLRTRERNKLNSEQKINVVVDGYTDFVFVNRNHKPYIEDGVYRLFEYAINAYNRKEERSAEKERRLPRYLPMFSAHNLRHTFCTRYCENETNLKVIQSIMGHSNISVTMNIYNHATLEKKEASMKNLNKIFGYQTAR